MNRLRLRMFAWLLLSLTALLAMGQAGATAPTTRQATSRATTAPSADQAAYTKWVSDLAGPGMEGRRFGTPGGDRAAKYLVDQYRAIKLPSAFDGQYLQPFKATVGCKVVWQPLALLDENGKTLLTAKAGEDFHAVSQTDGKARGTLAFAGYSVVNPKARYDSYAGLAADALKGQVVVLFRYEPQDAAGKGLWGPLDTRRASIHSKVALAVRRGAAAVLIVNPAGHGGDPPIRGSPRSPLGNVPVMQITPEMFRKMLVAAGEADGEKALAELQSAADKGAALRQYKNVTVSLELRTQPVVATSSNVGAVLSGRGNLAEEVVVVGAHYDHVGAVDNPTRKIVYPGADDNASGSAGVLMLARMLSQSPLARDADAPRRTILFVNFTGEEEGLLGSQYFVGHLSQCLPGKRVVAMINLDMIGRVRDGHLWIYGTESSSGWKAIVEAAVKNSPLKVWSGGEANGPSDYATFNAAKIPSVEFYTGMHQDVHQPTDTAGKINVAGAIQALKVALDVLKAAAAEPQPLVYSGSPGRSAILGLIPDNGGGKGLVVQEVVPDGPADKGGVRAGDMILTFQGKAMTDIGQLHSALGKCKSGDKVQLQIRRGKEKIDLSVTLGGR